MIPVFSKNSTFYIFLSIIIVYIIGMFVDIMDIDASQYASISREMLETKSFLIVKNRGQDYLDKPPLLFWLCSLSFQVFGFHNWSYKLPSVLFAILAIYAVYKFIKLYYSDNTAILGAVILGTTQAFFLVTNDCRTDTILAGSVMFAIWNIAAYLKEKKSINFIAGFVGIGLAMLAKGPIGLVVPVFAFGTDFLAKRDFKNIFRWEWLLGIIIILIVLSPMCLGLYQQYGFEGIKFYFWTQSFGRITGESQWRSDGGFFFMFHSFLWSFLPWSLFFIVALGHKLSSLVKSKLTIGANQEFIALGGSLLSYCALSLSKYQLPHYIYVFFPLVAVSTAVYISYVLQEKPKKPGKPFHVKLPVYCNTGPLDPLWLINVCLSLKLPFSKSLYLPHYFFLCSIYFSREISGTEKSFMQLYLRQLA